MIQEKNLGYKIMKRRNFIFFFITAHILFIAFQIDKQGKLVKLSYEKQRYEEKKEKLYTEKEKLTNTLYALKNHTNIKAYALKHGMKPLKLSQVKRLSQ